MDLTEKQKLTIDLLAHSPLQRTFYWTGGTLLAYHYLHHRESIDLDFFSESSFSLNDVTYFVQQLKEKGGFTSVESKKIFDRHEFFFTNEETLRVEFVHYNHDKKTLKPRTLLLGVFIDSLDDIAGNKTMAYFDRNEPKDLFDIYFLIHRGGFSPKKLLELVQKKFGVSFGEPSFWSESFKSLPLLYDVKPLLLEKEALQEKLLKTIEDYFRNGSADYLRQNLE